MSIGSFANLLYGSSKVTIVFTAQFALPEVNDVARPAVSGFGCVDRIGLKLTGLYLQFLRC